MTTDTLTTLFDDISTRPALVAELSARTTARKALERTWRAAPTPETEAALDAAIAAENAVAEEEAGASRAVTEWCLAGDLTFRPSEVGAPATEIRQDVRGWREAFVGACDTAASATEAEAVADAATH